NPDSRGGGRVHERQCRHVDPLSRPRHAVRGMDRRGRLLHADVSPVPSPRGRHTMTAVVDQRGRLFGRINLVDAAIGAFVVVLIPLAYATVLLFRPSKPTITSVDHTQMTNVEERAGGGTRLDGKLKIHGTGLRPTLRATI